MDYIRYLLYDLKTYLLIKFAKPKIFGGVNFTYFANGLGTFKTIQTNEPRSVELALKMQEFGIIRFLDIGASFGVWSLPFAKKLSQDKNLLNLGGIVVSVDAHLLSCEHLFLNSRLNDIDPNLLIILNLAVDIRNGYVKLYFPKYASNLGAINLKNPTKRLLNSKSSVFAINVASLIDLAKPHFVKIDIEGIDLMIAEQISSLDQNVEVMSIEVTPANLSKSGVSLLQEISKKFNFFILVTKEIENNTDDLKIYSSLEDVIKICEQTKKTNLFVFKNKELAQKLCLRTNK
jgi:FkbM family methyltransferase